MKKFGGRWMWILAAALLLAAPWWTLARPQLPDRGRLIDEARSLARAQDVRLKVIPLPEPLLKAGGNDDAHRCRLIPKIANLRSRRPARSKKSQISHSERLSCEVSCLP